MEAKKALEQIKSLLFADEAPVATQEEVTIEFAEGVLADGTIVKFDKLEAGGQISVVLADGEVPAPVGEHELEDGTIVVVAEEGVIAEVKMPELVEEEVVVSEEMSADPEEGEEEVSAEPQPDRFAEITEAFNTKVAELESRIANQDQALKQLVEFMEALTQKETAKETQAPKNSFMAQTKSSKDSSYAKLQSVFQNLKK